MKTYGEAESGFNLETTPVDYGASCENLCVTDKGMVIDVITASKI